MDAREPNAWIRPLRLVLQQCLPEGEPSAERLAHSLHLSLRGLQRDLSDDGSSYEQLLSEVRHRLAMDSLRDSDCAVSEVACLLGFADSRSFSRAFKRWSGQSLSQ